MKNIGRRILLAFIFFLVWILLISIIIPDSEIGISNVKIAIEQNPNIQEGQTWLSLLWIDFKATVKRFAVSSLWIICISSILIVTLSRIKAIQMFLDHFCESFRTIPATAWAFPIAMFPLVWISHDKVLNISVILATTPILTLGLMQSYLQIENSSVYFLAKRNKVPFIKKLLRIFLPWWALQSITHLKTTFSIVFILVVVLESILQGARISSGLGTLMGRMWVDGSGPEFAAEVFLLVLLAVIGILLSSLLDLLNTFLNKYRTLYK